MSAAAGVARMCVKAAAGAVDHPIAWEGGDPSDIAFVIGERMGGRKSVSDVSHTRSGSSSEHKRWHADQENAARLCFSAERRPKIESLVDKVASVHSSDETLQQVKDSRHA